MNIKINKIWTIRIIKGENARKKEAAKFMADIGHEFIQFLYSKNKSDLVHDFNNDTKIHKEIKENLNSQDHGSILIAFYGHGTIPDGFWLNYNEGEILTFNTAPKFKDHLLYANCCNTLKHGNRYIKEFNIAGLIGYNEEIGVIPEDPYFEHYEECFNSGLKELINREEMELNEIFEYVKKTYNNIIAKLYNNCVESFKIGASTTEKNYFPLVISLNDNIRFLDCCGDNNLRITI